MQSNYLPTIHVAALLRNGDTGKAREVLAAAILHELGSNETLNFVLYPVYLRGQVYLAAKQGAAAAAEFQKILDHTGIVRSEIIGALARLGLARAYSLSGDPGKAGTAYQDFLTLWKDADLDIPILKQAEAEYAKLQWLYALPRQEDRTDSETWNANPCRRRNRPDQRTVAFSSVRYQRTLVDDPYSDADPDISSQ